VYRKRKVQDLNQKLCSFIDNQIAMTIKQANVTIM